MKFENKIILKLVVCDSFAVYFSTILYMYLRIPLPLQHGVSVNEVSRGERFGTGNHIAGENRKLVMVCPKLSLVSTQEITEGNSKDKVGYNFNEKTKLPRIFEMW